MFIGLVLLAALWTPALADDEFCGDVTPREIQEHLAQAPVEPGEDVTPCQVQDHSAGELLCPSCGMKCGCCGIKTPSPLVPPWHARNDSNLADQPRQVLQLRFDRRLGRQAVASESPCLIAPSKPPVPPPR